MATANIDSKSQVERLNRRIVSASAVTCIFGSFRLLWALILPWVIGGAPLMIETIQGLVFLGFGLLMLRQQVWVFGLVLALGTLTFGYHAYLWIVPGSRGVSFLTVLSALMVITTLQAMRAHWRINKIVHSRRLT